MDHLYIDKKPGTFRNDVLILVPPASPKRKTEMSTKLICRVAAGSTPTTHVVMAGF